MAKAKEKDLTLRQEMRAASESKLEEVLSHAMVALAKIADSVPLDAIDIARMLVGGQTKTLRDKMVTQLTDKAEKDIVAMWNNQQKLELGVENVD